MKKYVLTALLLTITVGGCNQTGPDRAQTEIAALLSIYADFCSSERRPPQNSDEFLTFAEGAFMSKRPGQELCRPAIESGEYVVLWGADYWGEMEDAVPRVIIYQEKTPTDGGLVAYTISFRNSHVHFLTAEEFAATPKVTVGQ